MSGAARIAVAAIVLATTTLVGASLSTARGGGSTKGSLVLTGGAFGAGVIDRFVRLAGGPDANLIYIPSASSGMKLPSGFT